MPTTYFATEAALHEYLEEHGFYLSATIPGYWSNGLRRGSAYAIDGRYFIVWDV